MRQVRHHVLSRPQRVLAYLYYLRRPTRAFAPLLSALLAVLLLGGWAFSSLYEPPLSFLRALYVTYALVFMEHLLPFPEHWLLQILYVVLPPLGLVVILDGIVGYGYYLLRRDALGAEWNVAMNKTLKHHVILAGLGKAGIRILQHLLQLGEQVCVLEKQADCAHLAFARDRGVPVLIGSTRQEGILDQLGVARAKSIILATDDDLANIEMALDARKASPEINVVLRVFDQELASKIRESFDIQQAFSTKAVAAPLFATSSCDRSIVNAFPVGDRLLVVARLEIKPDSSLVGTSVEALRQEHDILVLDRRRNGVETFFPSGDVTLAAGDEVTVQTEPPGLKRAHQLNLDAEPY